MGTFPYIIQPGDSLWLIANKFHTDVNSILHYNPGTNLSIIYTGQVICIPIVNTIERHSGNGGYTKSALNANNHTRLLWEQLATWTRLFIISTVFGLPDANLSADRLLQNPRDFEAALRSFYGNAVAAEFAGLLTAHLTIAAELVNAAKAGNTRAAEDAETRWYANADEIALFLSEINPYWSAQEWKNLLYDHLAMTKTEAVDYLNRDYAGSITIFESMEKEALDMADYMTRGIIQQFPNHFIR
jgi:LysM repeat protein